MSYTTGYLRILLGRAASKYEVPLTEAWDRMSDLHLSKILSHQTSPNFGIMRFKAIPLANYWDASEASRLKRLSLVSRIPVIPHIWDELCFVSNSVESMRSLSSIRLMLLIFL